MLKNVKKEETAQMIKNLQIKNGRKEKRTYNLNLKKNHDFVLTETI